MNGKESPLLPPHQRPVSRVCIRRAESYTVDLAGVIVESLREFHIPVQGKSVLLKPNFVGLDSTGAMNTSPAVAGAAREAFLRLGARRVTVAEGPALERDTWAILEWIRLRDYIGPLDRNFTDLNTDHVRQVELRTRATTLHRLYFPESVLGTDFLVSMPKLKTHRWAGVSLSLKNLFGIVPGSCYGWPKNILHWAQIPRAILDIASTVRPDFAIVDGIVGMEGEGPLDGKPKNTGLLVMGDDPVAVDATCARIMGIRPERIGYLKAAGCLLGHLREENIRQLGEPLASATTPFELPSTFRKLATSPDKCVMKAGAC
ncbi:MAG TPA: DUF362 domain-containing protein [Terriglobia bacterium]|nr:DUF362 domain-containing protein [Terriglobia bacterium]